MNLLHQVEISKELKAPINCTALRIFILSLAVFVVPYISSAQNFEWVKNLGLSGISSTDIDSFGNSYSLGTKSVPYSTHMLINKIDTSGNIIWNYEFNSSSGYSITVEKSKNVYITGYFQGTVDFNPGPITNNLTSTGQYAIYICKFRTNGDFVWAKKIDGIGEGRSVVVDKFGSVYATGYFQGTADFNPGVGVYNLTTSPGVSSAFISKLDSNGNFVWAKQIDGAGQYIGLDRIVTIDTNNNLTIIGSFYSTIDFDPSPAVYNLTAAAAYAYYDAFILRLDNNGNFVWAKNLGGLNSYSLANSIAADSNGSFYISGRFGGTINFDPGLSNYSLTAGNMQSTFISKYSSNGNCLWVKQITGNNADVYIYSTKLDHFGSIYSTGYFQGGSVDFDPSPNTNYVAPSSNANAYILKLSSNGDFVWVRSFGGTGSDNVTGNSIAVDINGNIYSCGSFNGIVDFNPPNLITLNSLGDYNCYLIKYSQCLNNFSNSNISACDSYIWPLTGFTYTETGIYTHTTTCQTDTLSLSISHPILVTVNGPSNLCVGGAISLSNTISGGTWSSSNSNIAIVDSNGVVQALAPGSDTIIYTVVSACGLFIASKLITVNPIPAVTSITNQNYCNGQITSAITLLGTPNNVTFDIAGGASRGLANQTGVTSIPSFTAISGSSTVTVTPKANGCTGIPSTFTLMVGSCPPITLSLKFYIQGYYQGAGIMQPVMYNQGEITDTSSTQVDNVIVELHSALPPYAMIKTTIAPLNRNGTLTCSFSGSVTNTAYYIVVHHRNSVVTWSATPVMMIPNATYDFSTAVSKAFGNNQMDVSGNGTIWAFYNGDINQDENLDLLDLSDLESDVNNFQFGYFASDINGDGNVDLLDIPILENNISDFIFSMHP